MYRNLLIRTLLLIIVSSKLTFVFSQNVGINATGAAPNASAILDVSATDKGFLIPRVALTQTNSNAPIGASIITSLLVYNTATVNDVTPGFYYWDGLIWIRFQSNLDIDHDWYEVGTTTAPNAITDSMFHTGDVAIGKNTIGNASLDIANTTNASSIELTNTATQANNYGVLSNLNNASNTNAFGIRTNFTTTGNGILTGVFTNMDFNTQNGTGTHYGARNILYGAGPIYGTHNSIIGESGPANVQYGTFTEMTNSSGTGAQYGTRNNMIFGSANNKYGTSNFLLRGNLKIGTENLLGLGGGTSYGTYNDIAAFANYGYGSYTKIDMLQGEAYGTKNVFIGSSTGTKYGTYDSLATAGTGDQYGKYTELNGTGIGQQYANYNYINNTGNGSHYANYSLLTSNGFGSHYGGYNLLTGNGNGVQTGTYNYIDNTGSGFHYGTYNILIGNGSGTLDKIGTVNILNNQGSAKGYGVYNEVGGSSSLNQYGIYNLLINSGNGIKYALYDTIPASASGRGFGVFSSALDTLNDYAGFFRGKLSVGMDYTNNYVFPTTRGTNNQIMITDGNGIVTRQNASAVAAQDHDWYEVGTTTAPDAITDDMYHTGRVGIGTNNPSLMLQVDNATADTTAKIINTLNTAGTRSVGLSTIVTHPASTGFGIKTNTIADTAYAMSNTITSAGTGLQTGINNYISVTGNGQHQGINNTLDGNSSGFHYGVNNTLSGSGSGQQIAINNTINNSSTNNHFGVLNTLNGIGTGTHYGVQSNLTGTGSGEQTGTYNVIDNTGSGFHYGTFNFLSGAGSGTNQKIGTRNVINNSGAAESYGTANQIAGIGTANQYGLFSSISNTGNGTHYGLFNRISGTGVGNKYASYDSILASAGGNGFGVFSSALDTANDYAGFFRGKLSVGMDYTNNYVMPTTRGTNNQIMVTDNTGKVTWQNASAVTTQDHDWYEVGTTTAPDAISDSMFHTGDVAIGKSTIGDASLDIENSSNSSSLELNNTFTPASVSQRYGIKNTMNSNQNKTGIHNLIQGTNSSPGANTAIDNRLEVNGTSNLFAVYNTFASSASTGSVITGMRNWFQTGSSYTGFLTGVANDMNNNNNGEHVAIDNDFTGTGTGNKLGVRNTFSGIGNAIFYGNYTSISNTGTSSKYASYDTIPTSAGGKNFGVFSSALDTLNDYAGFFRGKLSVGMDYTNNYVMPTTRGTNNQIMVTDNVGKVTWQNASAVSQDQDWYEVGTTTAPNAITDSMFHTGDVAIGKNTIGDASLDIANTLNNNTIATNSTFTGAFGNVINNTVNSSASGNTTAMYNSMSNTGTGISQQTGIFNSMIENGVGSNFGIRDSYGGIGNASLFGVYNENVNNGNGAHTGVYTRLDGTGNGNQTGSNNYIANSGTTTHYGTINELDSFGTGLKYGTRNIIRNKSNAANYGTRNELTSSGTGAQYGTFTTIVGNNSYNHYGSRNDLTGSGDSTNLWGTYNKITIPANGNYGFKIGTFNDITNNSTAASSLYQVAAVGNQINGTTANETWGMYNLFLNTGSGTNVGLKNYLNFSTGTGLNYGVYNDMAGANNRPSFGIFDTLYGSGNGAQYGVNTYITNTGSGGHIGMQNTLSGTGTGNQIAVNNFISTTNNAVHWGTRSILSGNGSTRYGSDVTLSGTGTGVQYGYSADISAAGNSDHYGLDNLFTGTGTGYKYGTRNYFDDVVRGRQYANYNNFTSTGTDQVTGTYNEFESRASFKYGVHNVYSLADSGNFNGLYNFIENTGTGSKVGLSNLFNTMTTGGQIGVSNNMFSTVTGTAYSNTGVYNNIQSSAAVRYGINTEEQHGAPGDFYGVRNFSYGSGLGTRYGMYTRYTGSNDLAERYGIYDTIAVQGDGLNVGVQNHINGTGNGVIYGLRNNIGNTGTGIHYGIQNTFTGAGTGDIYGMRNDMDVTGTGDFFGAYTDISNSATGAGNKYGYRIFISQLAGGQHYGIYSNVPKAGAYAGYFVGDVRILGELTIASGGVGSNLVPTANNTYDLGTTALRWQDVWCNRNAFNGSDIRLKKEVKTTAYGLKEIMKLRPVNYTWKDNDRKDLGFIAQEIREILPELVMESKDSMNTLLMNYQGVIPVLVKAIQEQQAEIQQLKEENKDVQILKASVAEKDKQFMQLQQEVEKMKQFLGMSLEAKKN